VSTVDKMQALNQRVEDLDKEIAELQRQRDSLALAYSQNDKTAIKQVAQCDNAIDNATKEKSLLESAIQQLKSLALDEQAAVLEQVEEQRQSKAADLAESICDTNAAIDLKLGELCSLLKLRADNLNSLRGLNVVDPMYVSRMGRSTVTAAFAAAGLHKYIDMATPAPSSIRPMADGNRFLSGIGVKPVERVKASA
jgi:hypothetical protein